VPSLKTSGQVTVPSLRTSGQVEYPPLHEYIDSQDDPYLPLRFASPINLPHHARRHHEPQYRGDSPRSIDTSVLVEASDGSHGSLPNLNSSVESLAYSSARSSMAERQLSDRLRTLGIRSDDLLVADTRPPGRPVFQCPFRTLGCQLDYSNVQDWFMHSVHHFYTDGSRLAMSGPAVVMPPTNNGCCFCSQTFFSTSGMRSWRMRMDHVAGHHRIGHSLAHARPDFQLFNYLWETHLIDEVVYREIRGNTPDRSRMIHGNPSPPPSDRSSSPPSTPLVPTARPVAIMNERRHDRRRGHR